MSVVIVPFIDIGGIVDHQDP